MIKILTQNGIENTNLDGARDGYFNSGGKDGISSGILNNGTLTAQGNVLTLDTCEMRIKGHRIVIDEPITKTISGFPTVDTNYQFIAKITYNDGSVTFDTEARPTTSLIQDDILNGNGTYEVVIGEFIHKTDGTIANLVQIMHVIFGGSGVPAGGTTGQVLKKKSGTDYDTEWGDGGASGTGYILKPTALNDNNLPNVPIDKFQEAIEAYKAGIDVFLDLRGIPSFAHNTKIATAYRYFNSASGESLSFQLTYEYGYTLLARNGAVSVFEGDYAIPTNMESPAFSGKFWGYEDSDSEVHVGWKYPVISGTEAAPFMATKDNDLVTKKYFDDNKTGVGVPAGGTTGQVLKKKSGTDYDTEWGDGGSGGGVGHKGTGEGAEIFNSYEGEYANVASGKNSHAEGTHTKALKEHSHAEGLGTEASGARSHAEGESTIASGAAGHAEGGLAKAIGSYSHAEGLGSEASGNFSHAEGYATKSSGIYSHAEGYYTQASGEKQHVQGKYNVEDTENKYAHIVGNGESEIARSNAHTLDWNGNAWYAGKISGGTEANPAPVEKPNDYVTKKYFEDNKIEVVDNLTTPDATKALSAKQGWSLSGRIVGKKDFSGGIHAYDAEIFNAYVDNVASGNGSHAEGVGTKASGNISHAQGHGTIAGGEYQHAEGKYNIEDTENKYAHIVGNGTGNNDRSNAHTLDWNGNAWYAGKVSGGTEKYPAPVEKPNDYVTKKYFEEMRKGGLPINEGNTLSKLYFDTNTTPDLSIFTYALDETYGLETCTLILAESGENSYTLAAAKVPTSEDGSTFVYALVYIGADGSLTPLYASGACSFNAIELSAGWQSFSNPLSVNEYPITIIDNVVGWNGVWVSKKAFLVDTDDLQNALILTSPNGTKYRIKVADDGTLSTEAVTA